MFLFPFDPFRGYSFAKSQEPDEKYGIARAFLDAVERPQVTDTKPFPPFDIRLGSAKRLVAYWTTVAQRIRMEGSGILVPLAYGDSLRDIATPFMLHCLFTTPPSAKRYRELVKPIQTMLLKADAEGKRLTRRLALEAFWGKDILKCIPESWHAKVLERSNVLWQQEVEDYVEGRPTGKFRIAANADRGEISAVCHFLSRLFQQVGEMAVEGYVSSSRWRDGPPPIGDSFLAYALDHAGQTWRDKAAVRIDIMQREKAIQQELARRMAALTAYFTCLLEGGATPDHLLWRMSSFWPEDMFADYREAQRYLEEDEP